MIFHSKSKIWTNRSKELGAVSNQWLLMHWIEKINTEIYSSRYSGLTFALFITHSVGHRRSEGSFLSVGSCCTKYLNFRITWIKFECATFPSYCKDFGLGFQNILILKLQDNASEIFCLPTNELLTESLDNCKTLPNALHCVHKKLK